MCKYYVVIDLSKFNIPSSASVIASYGLYEIFRSLMYNITITNDTINAFLKL